LLSALMLVFIGLVTCCIVGWYVGKTAAQYCIRKNWM
jgi:hypothetical protein